MTFRLRTIGCLVALTCWLVGAAAAGSLVRIGGNSSSMPLLEQLAGLYHKSHPEVELTIMTPSIGSIGSMRALLADQLDLVISAKPPQGVLAAQLAPPQRWAFTPIALAGRYDKPVNFTLPQLADIYAGRLRQWPDGRPLRLMMRSVDVSDTDLLRALSPQLDAAVTQALARNGETVSVDAADTLRLLETTPNSLGSITLGLLLITRSPLRLASINGVAPSVQAVRDGRYPLAKPLLLVTRKPPGAATAAFIEFLRSPASIEFMRRFEYAPVAP